MSNLYEWKSDFGSNDTNTPANEEAINEKLGEYARSLKSVVRKDLSRFDASDNCAVGKAFSLYRSVSDADVASGVPHDFKLRDHLNTDNVSPSFKVSGNYLSVFTAGTRVGFVASGSYADLDTNGNSVIVTSSAIVSYQDEVYTQVFYTANLVKITWGTAGTIAIANPKQTEGVNNWAFTASAPADIPAVVKKKGTRILFKNSSTNGRANLFASSSLSDPNSSVPYLDSVMTVIVKSYGVADSYGVLEFYNSAREVATAIDGYSASEAEGLFPTDVALSFEKGVNDAWPAPADALFCTGQVTINDTDFVLVGSQSGNDSLNGSQHNKVTVATTIAGPIEEGAVYSVPLSVKPFPVVSETAGYDSRVIVQCSTITASSSIVIPDDVFNPVVEMNEWSTAVGAYDTVSSKRASSAIKLKFPSGIPTGVTVTYYITIYTPTSNGITYYPPA